MNGVQLENSNTGYSLAEPAGSSPASAPADRPSFDDHLQQARQQSEPPSPAPREEPPRETAQPKESASTGHESSPKEARAEHHDKEHAATTETPKKEPAGEAAAGEAAAAAEAGTIAIACLGGLNLPKEAAPAAAEADAAQPETADPAKTKASGAPAAKAAGPAATAKQLGGVIEPAGKSQLAETIITQTDTIAAAAAQATNTASATVAAPAQSLAAVGGATPARSKDNHAAKETPDDAPALAAMSFPVLDLPSPQPPGDVAPLLAMPDEPADKVQASSAAATLPQHNEDAPAPADAASPAPADNNTTKPPSFALPSRTSQHASGANLSEADRARFVQRVARAFESAGENGQMRLRLSPPELGSLRLDVSVHNGVLSAHVEAETPQARMLLLDNLPALRERLQEQNIKIERFDVDLMNQSPGGQPQSYRQQRGDGEEPAFNLQNPAPAIDKTPERPTPISRRLGGGEKLNIVI